MKYILYRAPQGLDKNVRQHELVAVEYGENIFDVTDSLIQDAADDLAGLPEYAGCDTAAKAPEPIESFRRVKKYQYEMLGIVYPPKGEKNFLIDFGIVEVCDFSCFHCNFHLSFLLGLVPCVSHSLHTTGEKQGF